MASTQSAGERFLRSIIKRAPDVDPVCCEQPKTGAERPQSVPVVSKSQLVSFRSRARSATPKLPCDSKGGNSKGRKASFITGKPPMPYTSRSLLVSKKRSPKWLKVRKGRSMEVEKLAPGEVPVIVVDKATLPAKSYPVPVWKRILHEKQVSAMTRSLIQSAKNPNQMGSYSQLKKEQIFINKHLNEVIAKWEKHNFKQERVQDADRMNIVESSDHENAWPCGFGFHIASEEAYSKTEEPVLSELYDVIMTLEDKETQDLLLSFLDDFKLKREALKMVVKTRTNLLGQVGRWMKKGLSLGTTDIFELEYALECDKRLCAAYFAAVNAVEKLKTLKREMDALPQQGTTSQQPSEGARQKITRTPQEAKYVAECLANQKACQEIIAMINDRDESIKADCCDEFIYKVEELAKCLEAQIEDMKKLKRNIVDIKTQMRDLREKQTESVKERIDLLIQSKEKPKINFPISPSPSRISVTKAESRKNVRFNPAEARTRSAAVQTERRKLKAASRLWTKSQSVVKSSASEEKSSEQTSSSSSPRSARDARKRQSFDQSSASEEKSSEQTSSSSSPRNTRSARDARKRQSVDQSSSEAQSSEHTSSSSSPRSARDARKRQSVDQSSSSEAKSSEHSSTSFPPQRYRFYNMPLEQLKELIKRHKKSSEVTKEPSVKDLAPVAPAVHVRVRPKHPKKDMNRLKDLRLTLSELFGQAVDLPIVPEEKQESLFKMTHVLNEHLLKQLKHQRDLLLKLRKSARSEMQLISTREEKVVDLTKKVKVVMDALETHWKSLPGYSTFDDRVEVYPRKHELHRCRFCACHVCSKSAVLDTRETAEAVGKTLEHCNKYTSLLYKLKERYTSIANQLAHAQAFMWKGLNALSWSDVNPITRTSQFSLPHEGIDHDINDLVRSLEEKIKELPEEIDLSQEEYEFDYVPVSELSQAVSTLARHVMTALRQAEVRMVEMSEQNLFLDDMESEFVKVEELLQSAMFQVTRLRYGTNGNTTGRMLSQCRCMYCCCYNSPFKDGLRDLTKIDDVAKQQRLAVTMAFGSVVQGQAAVETKVKDVDGNWQWVMGVRPEVMNAVEESKTSLLRALVALCHVDQPKLEKTDVRFKRPD